MLVGPSVCLVSAIKKYCWVTTMDPDYDDDKEYDFDDDQDSYDDYD